MSLSSILQNRFNHSGFHFFQLNRGLPVKSSFFTFSADFREENQIIYEEEMSKFHVLTGSF